MFVNFGFEDVKYFCLGLATRVAENETVKKVTRKVAEAAAGTAASFLVSKKLHEWFDKPKEEKKEDPKGLEEADSSKTIEAIS